MNIYFAHSTGFDFKNELYKPLRESDLNNKYNLMLPHELSDQQFNSKERMKNEIDVVVAEVSYPSTGMGIELGWADAFDKPIICIYKSGTKPSGAVRALTEKVIEYTDADDFVKKLSAAVEM